MPLPVSSGLVLHLETTSGLTTQDGIVTGWEDASASNIDLNVSGDPTLGVEITSSGAPSISLDGTDDSFEAVFGLNPLPAGNQNRTVFFVVNYRDNQGVSAGLTYGDSASNQAFGLVSGWNNDELGIQGYGGGNDFSSGVDAETQGWIVQSVVLTDEQYEHFKNYD